MSEPKTEEELLQAELTVQRASLDENLVSTACPQCDRRFVLLARYDRGGWHLRCTNPHCGWTGDGELKTK